MAAHFFDAFLGAIFGGVVTIAITIWLEHLRSPRIEIGVATAIPIAPRGPIANEWRSLRIAVSNRELPSWANPWLLRLPAQQCRAEISFLRLDGTRFLPEPMKGRWAGSPEPKVVHVQTATGVMVPVLTNPQELRATVDIYPGDVEQLDLAIRVDQDDRAYGWNDETYFYQDWRNPNRQLDRGRYIIEVTVASSGRKRTRWFRIDNDGPLASFNLAELTPEQRQVVGA